MKNAWLFSALLAASLASCGLFEEAEPVVSDAEFGFGWTGEERLDTVPEIIFFGGGGLPSSVDLSPLLPPIGHQGNYGTCVGWAVGYNFKTAISGLDRGLSSSQLQSSSNQFSPKDLYVAIPEGHKNLGGACNFATFNGAFEALEQRGVATMATVPYQDLGLCLTADIRPEWTAEAAHHKVKNVRLVDPNLEVIKGVLAGNMPIVFGASLPDNFVGWNTANVLSSGTPNPQKGHAMVLVGYDDNKGASGAFKLVNSWGAGWGAGGFAWVDYQYFMNEFCHKSQGKMAMYIATNDDDSVAPPNDPNPPTGNGVDLAPWVFSDFSTWFQTGNPLSRSINLNVYNIGNQAAQPQANWAFYYVAYNAFNADDWHVLFYDQFNGNVPPGTFNCPPFENYCDFNYSIPAGGDFAGAVFNQPNITRSYFMPQLTGQYYLVLVADASNAFEEGNEMNNFFYTTAEPKWFQNGYAPLRKPGDGEENTAETAAHGSGFSFENAEAPTLRESRFNRADLKNRNAYEPEEIRAFLKHQKQNGGFDRKIKECLARRGEKTAYAQ